MNNVNETPYRRDYSYIFLGEYPQTIAREEAVNAMGKTPNENGYFISGFDGARYAQVLKSITDDRKARYTFSNFSPVGIDKTYYFKVEPIKWRVLFEKNGTALLLSEYLLDNQRYHSGSDNWEHSELREWLNDEFFNLVFNKSQQNIIQSTYLDNQTTGYFASAQSNTFDKIFLLSYKDILNADYGFSTKHTNYDKARSALSTDYPRAKGIWVDTSNNHGSGYWWLRSRGADRSLVSGVHGIGHVRFVGGGAYYTSNGIRPAMWIRV